MQTSKPTIPGSILNINEREVNPIDFTYDAFMAAQTMPYQAMLAVPYGILVECFGPPSTNGDGQKSDAEWLVATPAGVAMIYNWKDGRNYGGEHAKDTKYILVWQVRGSTPEVVQWLEKVLDCKAYRVAL